MRFDFYLLHPSIVVNGNRIEFVQFVRNVLVQDPEAMILLEDPNDFPEEWPLAEHYREFVRCVDVYALTNPRCFGKIIGESVFSSARRYLQHGKSVCLMAFPYPELRSLCRVLQSSVHSGQNAAAVFFDEAEEVSTIDLVKCDGKLSFFDIKNVSLEYKSLEDVETLKNRADFPQLEPCTKEDAGQFFRGYSGWSGRYLFRTDGNIPIGLLDDTTRNEKRLYTVAPFRKNLLFLGNKGCGKTTALKTVLFGVTQNISPEKCNIIVLNFGEPGSFDEYRDLPHFCDVLDLGVGAKRESREKLERLPTILRQIIRNQSSLSQEKKTEFLLVIDGYSAFADSCPKIELEMQTLLVEGKAAGISLVITNRQSRTIPSEVRNSLQQRILLRSEDLDADLISEGTRRNQASRLCAGRGIVAAEDGRYFEMQLSFPACVPPEQYLAAVKDYARSYYDKNSYRAKAIPFMPEVLSLEQVRAKAVGSGCNILFGLDYADLQPVGLSLREMDCVFIEGTDRSGKSFLISQILRQLKRMPRECMVFFLDGKGQNPMPSGPNLTYIGPENLFVFLKSIENISLEAERETVVLVDDLQALYDKAAAKDKSVYDRFYRWLNVQRTSNRHVHFVLSCSAEANGYEVLPGFRFRERILLGNMMMQRRFAAPDALKNSYQNTTLSPYDAWIDLAGNISRVKLLNR